MFIAVLVSLVQLLCCVSSVGVGCCVRGGGLCLFRTLLVGVWAQVAPQWGSFLLLHVVGAVSVEEPTGD